MCIFYCICSEHMRWLISSRKPQLILIVFQVPKTSTIINYGYKTEVLNLCTEAGDFRNISEKIFTSTGQLISVTVYTWFFLSDSNNNIKFCVYKLESVSNGMFNTFVYVFNNRRIKSYIYKQLRVAYGSSILIIYFGSY